MGGGSSRDSRSRNESYQERSYSGEEPSSPWWHRYSRDYDPSPPPPPPSRSYASPPDAYAPPQQQHSTASRPRMLDRRYSKISDNYNSLDQVTNPRPSSKGVSSDNNTLVTEALSQAGLESSNLIVGIDLTKSNEWTGKEKEFQVDKMISYQQSAPSYTGYQTPSASGTTPAAPSSSYDNKVDSQKCMTFCSVWCIIGMLD
ncbi:hypothetical protein BHE74_00006312 [Ensete ventricosum]|nr:hypothetical protein BHE74_00006312 [Ensete ventricosum]